MPYTKAQVRRLMVQMYLPWRRWLGERRVERTVQGVRLSLPWSHMLPDYARVSPQYGQNLVELAAGLGRRVDGPLPVLDIGANVGDSALQIAARTDARVLCVEADAHWVDYLRRNLGDDPRFTIETVLITPDDVSLAAPTAVRHHGTTHFVADGSATGQATATVSQVRDRHPDFAGLRLVKSDTDGFDTVLVPAVLSAWGAARPVVFFEYDPGLTRDAGNDPGEIWGRLASLGYRDLAIWDNAGDPLGRLDVARAAEEARALEPRPLQYGYHFWDVAARHEDDAAAAEVFDALVPMPYSVHGTWR